MVMALLVISIFLNVVLIYSSVVMVKKLEQFEDITNEYEDRIIWFYEETSDILATARRLDAKEMFEKDDEVGVLFQKLMDTIGELRKLIYETEETGE